MPRSLLVINYRLQIFIKAHAKAAGTEIKGQRTGVIQPQRRRKPILQLLFAQIARFGNLLQTTFRALAQRAGFCPLRNMVQLQQRHIAADAGQKMQAAGGAGRFPFLRPGENKLG